MTRYLLDLDGDQRSIVRLLKRLLKVLLRDHGVRCRSITAETTNKGERE